MNMCIWSINLKDNWRRINSYKDYNNHTSKNHTTKYPHHQFHLNHLNHRHQFIPIKQFQDICLMEDLFIIMFNHCQPLPKWLVVMNSFSTMFLQFVEEHHQLSGRNGLNQRSKQTDLLSTGSTIKEGMDPVLILLLLKMIDSMNQRSSGGYCYIFSCILHYYFISGSYQWLMFDMLFQCSFFYSFQNSMLPQCSLV